MEFSYPRARRTHLMKVILAGLTLALTLPLFCTSARADAAPAAPNPVIVPAVFAIEVARKELGEQGWKDHVAQMEERFKSKQRDAEQRGAAYNHDHFLSAGLLPLGLKILSNTSPANVREGFLWIALYQEWKECSDRIDGAAPQIQAELRELSTLLGELDWTPANHAASSKKFWQRAADLILAFKEKKKKK